MKITERGALMLALTVFNLIGLFPPWGEYEGGKLQRNLGFIFVYASPPSHDGVTVRVLMIPLLTEFAVFFVVAWIAFCFVPRQKEAHDKKDLLGNLITASICLALFLAFNYARAALASLGFR